MSEFVKFSDYYPIQDKSTEDLELELKEYCKKFKDQEITVYAFADGYIRFIIIKPTKFVGDITYDFTYHIFTDMIRKNNSDININIRNHEEEIMNIFEKYKIEKQKERELYAKYFELIKSHLKYIKIIKNKNIEKIVYFNDDNVVIEVDCVEGKSLYIINKSKLIYMILNDEMLVEKYFIESLKLKKREDNLNQILNLI